jgi:hypothetical protein
MIFPEMVKVPSDHGYQIKTVVRRGPLVVRSLGYRLSASGVKDWRPFHRVTWYLSSNGPNLRFLAALSYVNALPELSFLGSMTAWLRILKFFISSLVSGAVPDSTLAGRIRSQRSSKKLSRHFLRYVNDRFVPSFKLTSV